MWAPINNIHANNLLLFREVVAHCSQEPPASPARQSAERVRVLKRPVARAL
jgi:hypothetical protein